MTELSLETFVNLLGRKEAFLHRPLWMEGFEYTDNGQVHMRVVVDKHQVFDIYTEKSDVSLTWRD